MLSRFIYRITSRPSARPNQKPTVKPFGWKPSAKPSRKPLKPSSKPSTKQLRKTANPTRNPIVPTNMPTESSVPLTILLQTDSKGYETWFFVLDVTNWNIVYHSTGPLSDSSLYTIPLSVDRFGVYKVYMHDDGGDGMCCKNGSGWYEVNLNGTFV